LGWRRCERLTRLWLTRVSCQVSRAFAELISASPFLEYRLEVFAAGLVENPHFSCSMEEGRRRVKEYMDVWKNFDNLRKRVHTLGSQDHRWGMPVHAGRNLLARRFGCSVSFIRVPRTTVDQQELEEWTVDPPVTLFQPCGFAVFSSDNVLALVERKDS